MVYNIYTIWRFTMYNHTKEYIYYLNDVEAMIIKIVSIVG